MPMNFNEIANEVLTTELMKGLLEEGLTKASAIDTAAVLGDRSQYIGASDVAAECERKAFYQKAHPVRHSLGTLVAFIRGHLVENMFHRAFMALEIPFEYQLEIAGTYRDVPIRIHPDFVLYGSKVIELKSGDIPDAPHDSWVAQNNFQICMMSDLQASGYEGYVLATDIGMGLNQVLKVFQRHLADQELYHRTLTKAERLWKCMQGEMDPELLETHVGPLCSWCNFRQGCPALDTSGLPELHMEDKIDQYLEILAMEREFKNQKEVIKGLVRGALACIGGPAKSSGAVITMRQRNSETCDTVRLRREFPDAYSACVRRTRTEYPEIRAQ